MIDTDLIAAITAMADDGLGYEDIAVKTAQPWKLIRHILRERYVKHQRESDGE